MTAFEKFCSKHRLKHSKDVALARQIWAACAAEAERLCRKRIVGRCPTCNKDGHRSMECFHLDHEGSNQIAQDCADAIAQLAEEN